VFCESDVTEAIYLDGLKQELRNAGVKIVVGPKHCEPLGLVRAALRYAKQFDKGTPEAFDEVWCVFDIEAQTAHGSVYQALQLAEDHGVKCAVELAAQLDDTATAGRNPWTDFYRLVDALRNGSPHR
jgi:RloB-like protein